MNRNAFLAFAFAAAAFAADPPVLIQNATILTVTRGTVKGSILLENGKIAAIGERVTAPAGGTLVDGSGKYVMPGIIDCHSHIAVDGAVNEASMSVASLVGIPDVLNPPWPAVSPLSTCSTAAPTPSAARRWSSRLAGAKAPRN